MATTESPASVQEIAARIECNENIVAVQPEEAQAETKGGIALPDQYVEDHAEAVGTVIATGSLRRFLDTGATADMLFRAGDRVAYSVYFKNKDRRVKIEGQEILFLDAGDILCKIHPN